MDWSKEQDERAAKLWTVEGWSAREIAQEFGVTRNSVIGKMHRMKLKPNSGLTCQHRPRGPSKTKQSDKTLGINIRRKVMAMKSDPGLPLFALVERPVVVVPYEPKPTPLSLAKDDQCRFIAGEPVADAIICGGTVEFGTSWCAHHLKLLYNPRNERRTRREPISVYRVFGQVA